LKREGEWNTRNIVAKIIPVINAYLKDNYDQRIFYAEFPLSFQERGTGGEFIVKVK
jgi:hypothetical protein